LQTTNRECDHTIELYTTEETIETTAEHPFYTTNGWKDAANLQAGDKIITQNDESIEIIETKFNYEPKQVYNFEVADWHTYFVGVLAWLVHNAAKCVTTIVKQVSKRLKYLGRTPGKGSKTGKEVFERMLKKGEARIRKVGKKEIREFYDPDNKVWRNIKNADMGHKKDAVSYWNKTGRKFGAKSKEVRDWMLDSKNYKYEYFRTNRSRGAKLGEQYKPPLK
jgi:Pretoxin HINT domain/HNH/ENDO VII superfamily nuclease with conserved GHE residues